MSNLIGYKVRRRPEHQRGWWGVITRQRGLAVNKVFTVIGSSGTGFVSLEGFDLSFNNSFDFKSFEVISSPEKVKTVEKIKAPAKQSWALAYVDKDDNLDIQEFSSREQLRRWNKMMKGCVPVSAKTPKKSIYRLEKKDSGVITLTPTKL